MAKKEQKKAPGRPIKYNWKEVNKRNMWQNKSNAEIARFLGCTPANVCNRRKKLIAEAEKAGKSVSRLTPREGVKFRREVSNKGQDSPATAEA